MVRILLGAEDTIEGDAVIIRNREGLHHLAVLRVQIGEIVEALDGRGNIWEVEVKALNIKGLEGRVVSHRFVEKRLPRVYLAVALVPFSRFDAIVEKAMEIGVDRLYPIAAERSIVPAKRVLGREKRWQRIIKEACKQCGGPHLMEIAPILPLAEALMSIKGDAGILIPHLNAGPRQGILRAAEDLYRLQGKKEIIVCIGPEGDWTQTEIDTAMKMGAIPVSLGYNVLRVDTAAIAAGWALCSLRGV